MLGAASDDGQNVVDDFALRFQAHYGAGVVHGILRNDVFEGIDGKFA